MPRIEIEGKGLYYEVHGENREHVLLYLHGGPGASCLDFSRQAEAIGRRYQVVALDQYGVLRSDGIAPEEDYGMLRQIGMLEQMRKELNIPRWAVLGHSYGGMLACLYANRRPDSVEAVIYECPSFFFALSTHSIAQYMLAHFTAVGKDKGIEKCSQVLKKACVEGDRTMAEDVLEILSLVEDQQVRNYLHGVSYEKYAGSYSIEGITEEMWERGNTHFDKIVEDGQMFVNHLPLLAENPQPSLLLCGAYDPVCVQDQQTFYREHAKGGRIVRFDNSGHFPRIEEAEKYTATVCGFLDGLGK